MEPKTFIPTVLFLAVVVSCHGALRLGHPSFLDHPNTSSAARRLAPAEVHIDCEGFTERLTEYVDEQLIDLGTDAWTDYICNPVMNEMDLRPVIENPGAHFTEGSFGAYANCAQEFFEYALDNTVIRFLPDGGYGAAENDCANVVGSSLEHHLAKVTGQLEEHGSQRDRRLEIFITIIVSVITGTGVGLGLATTAEEFDPCDIPLGQTSVAGSIPRPFIGNGQVQSWLASSRAQANVLTCNIESTREGLNLITQPSSTQFPFRFLSTSASGEVDMYCRDDDSGRQVWNIIDRRLFGDEGYNIVISGGTNEGETFLSTSESGNVDLWFEDDGSGRQRWLFDLISASENSYSIRIVDGSTNEGETYLSTDGNRLVDLWNVNDGSGRQDWQLDDCSFTELGSVLDVCKFGINVLQSDAVMAPGDVLLWLAEEQTETALSCEIRTECGSDFPYLSTSADGIADMFCTNDGTGRQRFLIQDAGHGHNILVSDGLRNQEAAYLTSSPNGFIYTDLQAAGAAQTWFFYSDGDRSNQFQILVESGTTNEGERYLSTDCNRLVDLFSEVESNRRQLWSLRSCFEVPLE